MRATPAINRALIDLEYLLAGGYITVEMAQRGRDVVGLLFTSDTIYASIGPIDDGDLSFYWRAGDQSISIDLGADGTDWASVRDGEGRRWIYDSLSKDLWDHLQRFSKHVEAANPAWRLQPQ